MSLYSAILLPIVFASLYLDCELLPNHYTPASIDATLYCNIIVISADPLSNSNHSIFFIMLNGVQKPPHNVSCSMLLDNITSKVIVSSNEYFHYYTYFFGPLDLKKGKHHSILLPVNLTGNTNLVDIILQAATISGNKMTTNYEVYATTTVYGTNTAVHIDCQNGIMGIQMQLVKNTPIHSNVQISFPAYIKQRKVIDSVCTDYIPLLNMNKNVSCYSNDSTLKLYEATDHNMFNGTHSSISFNITGIVCTEIKQEQPFVVSVYNTHSGINVISEELITIINITSTNIPVCQETQYNENFQCYQCKNNCVQCTNQTNCFKCSDKYVLYLNRICDLGCPTSYFNSSGICRECSLGCNSCKSLDSCEECIAPSYYMYNNKCVSNCPYKTYGYNMKCRPCPDNCVECNLTGCLKCEDISNIKLVDGKCECNAEHCKSNCAISDMGCSVCNYSNYFYDEKSGKCASCSLNSESSYLNYTYNICTGHINLVSHCREEKIGIGYSGLGSLRNDVCKVFHNSGPILPAVYNVTGIKCQFKGRGGSRILNLQRIQSYSDDNYYSQRKSNYSIYSEPHGTDNYQFTEGDMGIVLPNQIKEQINIGDMIRVHVNMCDVVQCHLVPPPVIGTVEINVTGSNELIVTYIGWGGYQYNSIFSYSVQLLIGNYEIELCDNYKLLNSSLLCNANNSKHLGSFGISGVYTVKVQARYKQPNAIWAGLYTNITLHNIPIQNSHEVLSKSLNYTDIYSLYGQIVEKILAISYISPTQHSIQDKCPPGYCVNGNCSIINRMPKCKCSNGYSGNNCNMLDETRDTIASMLNKGANSLVNVSNDSDLINTMIRILANSDMLSLQSISQMLLLPNIELPAYISLLSSLAPFNFTVQSIYCYLEIFSHITGLIGKYDQEQYMIELLPRAKLYYSHSSQAIIDDMEISARGNYSILSAKFDVYSDNVLIAAYISFYNETNADITGYYIDITFTIPHNQTHYQCLFYDENKENRQPCPTTYNQTHIMCKCMHNSHFYFLEEETAHNINYYYIIVPALVGIAVGLILYCWYRKHKSTVKVINK